MIATQEDVISLLKNTLAVLQMFLINSNFRASTNFSSVDLVDENKGVYKHPKLVSRESH